MNVDLTLAERNLLQKILDSYLSELRNDIAATKRDTATLHSEERLINQLQQKLGQAK